MSARFDGQVGLVTGAAQGLGRAFVEALRAEGMSIAACDVKPEVHELDAHTTEVDVSDPGAVAAWVDNAVRTLGRVDLLVSNAGVVRPTRAGDAWDQGLADYAAIMDTNVRGVFLCGRAVVPHMLAQGSGHIVNLSTDHVYPTPGHEVWGHGGMDVYNASKWALNGLTLDWATTLRRKGIRVNALCMGATDTPMLRAFAGERAEEQASGWMQPAEIAGMLVELHAEGPEGRTGHNVGLWVDRPRRLDDSVPVGHRRSEGG